jgi:hypothetical protein
VVVSTPTDSEAVDLLKKSEQAEDEILANFGGVVGLSSLLVAQSACCAHRRSQQSVDHLH